MADNSVRSVSTLGGRETIEYEIYNDLKEKYEALAQQFMTIQLEKEELVEEMKRMQQQNAELKELEKYEHEEIEQFEQFTQPLFQGSIATMSVALNDADLAKKSISAQKDEYKELNNKLKQEIDSLKAENKKYQSALQDMTINQQKKEKEYQHKIELSQAEIQDINIEQEGIYEKYRQLENEYNILKQETSQQLQSQMEATTPNADVGAIISDQKTMRFAAPRTMRSSNIASGSFANIFDEPQHSERWQRLGLLNTQSEKNPQYVEYDDSERSAVSGDDEDALRNDDTKEAKDYGYDNVVKEMEQQLQSEYDEMLRKERGKLMEQHRFEINELNQQISKFKKIAMEKNMEINRLKSENLNGGKNERNQFKQRPNNEPDLAKCKVFGWTAW